jgi:DNA-directed RNA polymerase subunit E'/Rpb7
MSIDNTLDESNLMKTYVNTFIETKELLYAYQMDNDLEYHIKQNLIKNYEGRCYKNYGFISKIYKINEIKQHQIISEDIQSSQFFGVNFTCKLYYVINGKEIICKMDKISEKLSTAINGPLKVIITLDCIDNNLSKKEVLEKGVFVRTLIRGFTFEDKSRTIIAKGYILSIATKEEIKKYYEDDINEINENELNTEII